MTSSRTHSDALRRQVIFLFFLGLLVAATIALGISWICGDWGMLRFKWLNQVFGPMLTLIGFALVSWSVHIQYTLGKGTPVPKVATQKLVTRGPYAYSRNPMTLGALVLYLGIGGWIGSGVVIILTIIVFSSLLTFIYIHETHELTQRFGDKYLAYKKRTPFLFPRLTLILRNGLSMSWFRRK